jgi:hypothetical protein
MTRFAEMLDVDTTAIRVAVRVQAALRLRHLWSAGEYHISRIEKLALATHQLGRRTSEFGKLVHAIIHDGRFIHVPQERCDRHWVVEPENRVLEFATDRLVENCLHDPPALGIHPCAVAPAISGHLHLQHDDIRVIGYFAQRGARGLQAFRRDGAFNEEDGVRFRQPRMELLRTLPNPIPAEVREDDDGEVGTAKLSVDRADDLLVVPTA